MKQKVIESIRNRVYGYTDDVLLISELKNLKDAIASAEEKYNIERYIVLNKIEEVRRKRAADLKSTEEDITSCYEDIITLTSEKLKWGGFSTNNYYKEKIQDKLNQIEKLQEKWNDVYEPYAEDINNYYNDINRLKAPVFQCQDKLDRETAKINDKKIAKTGSVGWNYHWYLEQKEREWENLL